MPTNARYFSNLIPNQPKDNSLTLLFDYLGNINFYSLNLLQTVSYSRTQNKSQTISLSDITNASIFYALICRMKEEVGSSDFYNVDLVQDALIAKMNIAIENKKEVALEIISSWHRFAQFTQDKSRFHSNKSILPTIADFPEKINYIIYILLAHQLNKLKAKQPINLKDLSQLSLTLECITRNMVGSPFCFKLDIKSLLSKLAKQVDAFVCHNINNEFKNYFLPLQEFLQKELITQNGNWLSELIAYLNYELDNIPPGLDDSTTEKEYIENVLNYSSDLSKAITNLLNNEFSPPCTNNEVEDLIKETRKAMQLNKTFINSFLQRDKLTAEKIGLDRLQETTQFALTKAALSNHIALEPSAIYRFKPSYYDYKYFNFVLNHLNNLLGITENQVNIFGFVLAKLAHLPKFPIFCTIEEEDSTHPNSLIFPSQNIIIKLGLSAKNTQALIDFLNINYGNNTATLPAGPNTPIKVNLVTLIEKIVPDYYQCLIPMLLKNNRIKEIYQQIACYRTSVEDLLLPFQKQCTALKRPFSYSLFATTLLKAFNIDANPSYIEMFRNENRTDALLDIDIYFGNMTLAVANELVKRINTSFPKAYATVHEKSLDNGLPNLYQHISFDKTLFSNHYFNNLLANKLKQISSNSSYRSNVYPYLFNAAPAAHPVEQPVAESNCIII
ncbi:Uncharacterised protein [Legionella busanensis]|uniref:Uncharacterized protein n=1 Tax=Legionella busanensis TaxID=190655 RepID=A0A378JHH1_9GAMM|nr:hypothetical protein [Legionella busanensis]STX50584.1 Uncharacterised protein [Legionella busanensis]